MEKFKIWFSGLSKNTRIFIIAVVVGMALSLLFSNSESKEQFSWLTFMSPTAMAWNVFLEDGTSVVCTLGSLTEENKNVQGTILNCINEKDVEWASCVGGEEGSLTCNKDLSRSFKD